MGTYSEKFVFAKILFASFKVKIVGTKLCQASELKAENLGSHLSVEILNFRLVDV